MTDDLAHVVSRLPERFSGPGGAFAVIRDGDVLEAGCWGWADRERRLPFTRRTPTLVCSITKQFTCAALLETEPDPEALAPLLAARLPALAEADRPPVATLCHNQSGIRDYWALAMLCGSPVEGRFDEAAWRRIIASTRSLHFRPGTRYAYSNGNFRLLSDMLEERTGRDFGALLGRTILDRAGMETTRLASDTADVPGGTIGYEGGPSKGYRQAVNRIVWTGDAGLSASLDDMIAWECFIDRTRDQADGIYARLAAPVAFADGAASAYGYGLARTTMRGRSVTGHAGGLRGFRSFRLHSASDRVSVVVLFNHMADPREAAEALFAAAIGAADAPGPAPADVAWSGRFIDAEAGLATRLENAGDGGVRLHFAWTPETLAGAPDGGLVGPVTKVGPLTTVGPVTKGELGGGALVMRRPTENLTTRLDPAGHPDGTDAAVEGRFRNEELDAVLTVVRSGGVLFGAFSGFLGEGAMETLVPFGADIFLLPCPRALDYGAPGDWTLALRRDAGGRVSSIAVGCWLARRLPFDRI